MSNIIIRAMTQADIPFLCRAEDSDTPEGRECFERYFSWQQNGECTFLLAFLNGHLAGHLFVFYHDHPVGPDSMDMSRLADLLVYPEFRSQGIASVLLEEGERLAGTVSTHAFLTVDPDDPQAFLQSLYTHRGYEICGREGDDLVMIKQLLKT